jgi:FtsP/CotA-like multicopper oxidase with cupredoxin domain
MGTAMPQSLNLLALGVVALLGTSTSASVTAAATGAKPPRVVPNDNRAPAGTLKDGVLTLRLVAQPSVWRPEGPDGADLPIYAFAEEGKAPRVPGPLIRVPVGTELRISVRNALPETLRLYGLLDRPASAADSLDIAPGQSTVLKIRAGLAGTYFYNARTSRDTFPFGHMRDGQLSGAIVVDTIGAPTPPNDRVFVLGLWRGSETPFGTPVELREEILVFNGRAWPHTERLSHTVGDTVHWRFINTTRRGHPLHLHGFYYRVDARGNVLRDTLFPEAERRTIVTELVVRGTTMAMTWSPHTPGNWLFHCHLVEHISGKSHPPALFPSAHANHGATGDAMHDMSGLVMGIHVRPAPNAAPSAPDPPRRTLRLFVNQRPAVYGEASAYAFVLQEGDREPAPDSLRLPGSTITLVRGEPAAITVINRAREPVSVHWHGIELDSYFDGVGQWSGIGKQLAPAIAPGDSFIARMTPRRAGTFMYHTHAHEVAQMGGGLYAPLLVLEPGQQRDTTIDRVFLLSTSGPFAQSPPNVNGDTIPARLELQKGMTYRLRFIAIAPHDTKVIRLLADTVMQRWRAVAKDGFALPPNQAVMRGARLAMGTGETWDVELTPTEVRDLTLEIVTLGRAGLPPVRTRIPVHVRD